MHIYVHIIYSVVYIYMYREMGMYIYIYIYICIQSTAFCALHGFSWDVRKLCLRAGAQDATPDNLKHPKIFLCVYIYTCIVYAHMHRTSM